MVGGRVFKSWISAFAVEIGYVLHLSETSVVEKGSCHQRSQ